MPGVAPLAEKLPRDLSHRFGRAFADRVSRVRTLGSRFSCGRWRRTRVEGEGPRPAGLRVTVAPLRRPGLSPPERDTGPGTQGTALWRPRHGACRRASLPVWELRGGRG